MPSRQAYNLPGTPQKRKLGLRNLLNSINDSPEPASPTSPALTSGTPADALARTLSPASATVMNTLKLVVNTENKDTTNESSVGPNSFQEDQSDIVDESISSKAADKVEGITMHHATNGRLTGQILASHTNQERSPVSRTSPMAIAPTVRNLSAEFGPLRTFSNFSIAEDNTASNTSTSPQQQWSSAVGRANLGKSGRVIEKLMAENDMLKRELQIAKLAVEQSKDDARMAEGRMEALSGEYEARLHDAQITKTLLKKRDRQVAEMKGQIDGERQRADAAVESERSWKVEVEKMEFETKRKVDDATSHALLMEGRNNALSGHWKEQGALVESTVLKMKTETSALLEERLGDFRRMELLQDVCDQKNAQLAKMESQNKAIMAAFEAYKAEQDSLLRDIKEKTKLQERASEALHDETQRVLGEMRWVLAVNRDLRENT